MLATAFIAVYLAVQIALPVAGLVQRGGFLLAGSDLTHWDGGQVHFGWQMFATVSQDADYRVVWQDGSVGTVNSVSVLGRIRGRAHYADVPERLCAELGDAVAVRRHGVAHRC